MTTGVEHTVPVYALDDLPEDIIVEIASNLTHLSDLSTLFKTCRRLHNLSNRVEIFIGWLNKRGIPLSRKDMRLLFSRRTLEEHLNITKMLVSGSHQGHGPLQDWDEWALCAIKLGRADVADYLYSTPAFIAEEDESQQFYPARVGDVTDLMLMPLPLTNTGTPSSSHPTTTNSTQLSRRSGQKRPLIQRSSYSVASSTRHQFNNVPTIMRASTSAINQESATTSTSGRSLTMSANYADPSKVQLNHSHPSTSMGSATPHTRTISNNAEGQTHPPSLTNISMASSNGGTSCTFRGLAMPSMQILQRNSRNLMLKEDLQQLQQPEERMEFVESQQWNNTELQVHNRGYLAPGRRLVPRMSTASIPWHATQAIEEGDAYSTSQSNLLGSSSLELASQAGLQTAGNEEDVGLRLADVHYYEDAALRHASHQGDLLAVQMLIGHGADVTARDGMALTLAAGGGHVDVAKFLVQVAGADVRAGGSMALSAAIASDKPSHLAVLSLLLEKGANIHVSDNFALRWACYHGRYNVAKLLVEHGADVSAGMHDALYQAAKNGHTDIVKMLLANGADPTRCKDAVARAEQRGHTETGQVLKAAVRKGLLNRLMGYVCMSGQ
ncbi:hypothetical protein CEUSTIGMA_g11865.t1 [Chlamydomonas eustigma]|uniref:Uncharacterized protein n=1 Tax=Chlamydomonas eustigma TaxID=1157962 RepID=A0A250XMW5_9CHLO|nr:hypothetical protein CEUSTIGMA_g11865.t1 [Chlamydomonas eustigma]|eukprot:GAX84445.1 hypothetical protein CEUSTIGMA_g11865.t1 [Chlamydomonas eustigma]